MQVRSILTIMDKPKHPQTALVRALKLQTTMGARMELASFCFESLKDIDDLLDQHNQRAIKGRVIAERKAWQRAMLEEHGGAAADVTFRTIWTNGIAEWVRRRVEESDHDLIVKSVHYSKSLLHTPLDWQLLREARVPLLLTSTRERKPSGNVLAAIDLKRNDRVHTRLNRNVLDAAHSMAQAHGATVHCVYVIEISQVLRDLDAIDPAAVRRRAIERSRAAIDELVGPYQIAKSRIHMPVGKVGQTVAGTAHALKADLLVIGTAAHRARQLAGLGNSAERVLARAPCDVLAVHPT